MRKLIITILLLLPLSAIAADKTFSAGESLTLSSNTTWDSAYSNATENNWAVVTGPYNIIINDVASLKYVSFQNTGTITISVNSSGDYAWLRNCVFAGQSSITIGTAATTPSASDIMVDQCDFRSIPTITFTGTNASATGEVYIRRSTFDSDTAGLILIQNIDGFRVEENVLNNYQFGNTQGSNWTMAGDITYRYNFQVADSDITVAGQGSNFKWVTVNIANPEIRCLNNYWYLDLANPHPVSRTGSGDTDADVWTGNIFEVAYNTDGANILSVNANRATVATHNILIGSGSLLNNVGSTAFLALTGSNNTCYCTRAGNEGDGILFLSESGPADGTINLSNNIISGSADPTDAINSITGTQTITSSDYNWFYNVTNPYDDVTVSSGQGNDVSDTDPNFVDPARNLTQWFCVRYGDETPTKAEAVEKLLALNGYNSSDKTQSDTPILYSTIDLLNYVRAGFVPQAAGCNQGGALSEDVGALDDEGWSVWADTSLVKNRRDGEDNTSGDSSISLKMAKNEFESFQVFVYADGTALDNVDIHISPVTSGSNTITDVYLYKQFYINCQTASREEFPTGYYPDPLIPKIDRYYGEYRSTQWPVDVTTSDVQGFWIEIGTDSSTVPGTYTGTITVMADGKKPENIALTLTVWNFTLPSTSTFDCSMGLQTRALSDAHMNTLEDLTANATLVPLYMKAALYHRISLWITGGSSGVTYSWSPPTLSSLSTTLMDSYFDDVLNGAAISSGPLSGAKASVFTMPGRNLTETDGSISNADKSTAATQYIQQYYDHYESQGWDTSNFFVTVSDEPNCSNNTTWRGETVTECEQCIDQAADAIAIESGTFTNVFVNGHNQSGLSGFGGFFCPWIGHFSPAGWEKENSSSTYIYPHSGYPTADHYWTYLSCMSNGCTGTGDSNYTGQVDLSADATALYNRMMSFLFRKYSRTGFLYWGVNSVYEGAADPWNAINTSPAEGGNGDGLLFYPGFAGEFGSSPGGTNTPNIGGRHDIPIESMRLKLIRDALEDMEYFTLIDAAGKTSEANTYVNTMFTQTDDIDLIYWDLKTDVDTFLTARDNIGELLDSSPSTPSLRGVSLHGVNMH